MSIPSKSFFLLVFATLFSLSCVREFDPEPDTGQLRVTPNPINLTNNIIGGNLPITLSNVGLDSLTVDSVRTNNSAVTISLNAAVTIAPERSTNSTVRFNYDAYDGAGNVLATFYLRDEEPVEVDVRTPFKRILINLSDHPSNNRGVAFSSDGVDVLFYSDRDESYDIFLVDRVGDNLRQITEDQHNNIPVAFTSDNNRILFNSDRNGVEQAYFITISSGEIEQITDSEHPAFAVGLSNDDGQLLYYTNEPDNRRNAWLHNISTGQTTLLSPDNGGQFERFTPVSFIESETRIMMRADFGNLVKTFLVTTGGDNLINVVDDDRIYHPVAYSQSNLRIVAYSNRSIYSFSPQGTDFNQITNSPHNDFPVALSPNDAHVLFYSDRDDRIDVYVTNFQGSSTDRITANPYHDRPVTFAPNNNTILFNSDRNTYGGTRYTQVYVTDLN